jgi:hypothetical protein
MRELLIPDSRKWFVTPDLGTNVFDGIRGPSRNVIMNDKNCEVNIVV